MGLRVGTHLLQTFDVMGGVDVVAGRPGTPKGQRTTFAKPWVRCLQRVINIFTFTPRDINFVEPETDFIVWGYQKQIDFAERGRFVAIESSWRALGVEITRPSGRHGTGCWGS
jgi:hypothetical protein